MDSSGRIVGDRVMCHSCQSEWQRSQGGLICPSCESDFTEILENTPSPPQSQSPPLLSSPHLSPFNQLQPFHNHDPWADVPDPEEDDIRTFRFNTSNGGHGTVSVSTRTYTTRGNGRNVMLDPDKDPAMADLTHSLVDMLTKTMRRQTRRGFFNDPMTPAIFPFGDTRQMGGFGGFTSTGIYPGGPRPGQAGNFNDLFSMLFHHLNAIEPQQQVQGPGNPFAILSQLFNPADARHGDAVFSQEAFDRVMSQMMDQNPSSTAPGPASDEAIQSLPTKAVEKDMMGSDGKAECSICMDNVEIGDRVTVLPCNHWFHGPCVTAWLTEHDTCPHCRKPITNPEGADQTQPSGSSRRSSSVASPFRRGPDGSRGPYAAPQSPTDLRDARQQYYGTRRLDDYDRPRDQRHSSYSESRSQHGSRNGGSSGSGGSNGSNGGGVSGWIRDHLPFQG